MVIQFKTSTKYIKLSESNMYIYTYVTNLQVRFYVLLTVHLDVNL
jgi:hypothetical protein